MHRAGCASSGALVGMHFAAACRVRPLGCLISLLGGFVPLSSGLGVAFTSAAAAPLRPRAFPSPLTLHSHQPRAEGDHTNAVQKIASQGGQAKTDLQGQRSPGSKGFPLFSGLLARCELIAVLYITPASCL